MESKEFVKAVDKLTGDQDYSKENIRLRTEVEAKFKIHHNQLTNQNEYNNLLMWQVRSRSFATEQTPGSYHGPGAEVTESL